MKGWGSDEGVREGGEMGSDGWWGEGWGVMGSDGWWGWGRVMDGGERGE